MRCTGMRHRRSRRDASGSESKASWNRVGEKEWRSVGRQYGPRTGVGKPYGRELYVEKAGSMTLRGVRVVAINKQSRRVLLLCLTRGCWCRNKQQGLSHQTYNQEDPSEGHCSRMKAGWCSRSAVTQQKTTSSGAKQMLVRQPMQVNVVENRERGRGQRQGQRRWRW